MAVPATPYLRLLKDTVVLRSVRAILSFSERLVSWRHKISVSLRESLMNERMLVWRDVFSE